MTFDQAEWEIRFEWGIAGASQLAPLSGVAIVDVLRSGQKPRAIYFLQATIWA
ncbi:MAG: hypothetical protein JO182_01375 [Acidobacteriaceae bacterium]|nr:hypothetical protein [Acidobacteriaceae bacterium]